MARSKLTYQVKASSIMEVVVSMVIIIVVFGIAMMIYTNVLKLSLSSKKLRTQAILKEAMLKTEHSTERTNQTSTVDDFRIEQEIKAYNDDTELTSVIITAYDSNQQKIAELKKVIINDNE